MSAVDLLDAFNQVRQEVHLCPEDLIRQAILDTLRDFCRVTRVYRHEVNDEEILLGQSDYVVKLPDAQTQPIAIEHMAVDEALCVFKSTDWLDANVTNWRFRAADDFTYFTHLKTPAIITFPCVPTKNGTVNGVTYRVSIRPIESATSIDDSFSNEWKGEIEDGAKSRLLLMANKSWTNAARGGDLETRYRAGRGQARIRANRSFGNAEESWIGAGPRFA